MRAILLSNDLALSSKVAAAAVRQNVPLVDVRSTDELLAADPTAADVVILDLDALKSQVAECVTRLKSHAVPRSIVAFGPHVHEALLQAARDAGCDVVLSRGQFHARMEEMLSTRE